MRSLVQGLDTRGAWDRYLRLEGEHDDIRNVRRTIQWIRDEFAASAKRHDRYGTARLVQIDASRIEDKKTAVPTLEEFAAENGLLDFSESEQLEYYYERYGSQTSNESRRARLIAKQLDALAWLESLVSQAPPRADDMLGSWVHPDLAAYLQTAGIVTIRQLVDRINGKGKRWWSGIRAIGAIKAQRLMDWLRANEATIGMVLGSQVLVKRSQLQLHDLARVVLPATAVVPLEKLVIPSALDGANGVFRAPRHLCRIPAQNDFDAVLAWIRSRSGMSPDQIVAVKRRRALDPLTSAGPLDWLNYLSNTQRAYRKEAERFLLWAIIEHQKPLSAMTAEDCMAYVAFLAKPTPTERWCGARNREKWSPLWRPFEGPLSPGAQRQAIIILKGLYQYLVNQCYLVANPWEAVSLPKAAAVSSQHRRFTREQWAFIERRLDLLPRTSANQRLRVAVRLLYQTGIRLAEATSATYGQLSRTQNPSGASWTLILDGKQGKGREVTVPESLINELADYLSSRGLSAEIPHANIHAVALLGKASDIAERAPWAPRAIRDIDPKAGITPATLYAQIKAFFIDCSRAYAEIDAAAAKQFAAASTHWLRHTHVAHSARASTSQSPQRARRGTDMHNDERCDVGLGLTDTLDNARADGSGSKARVASE